jgi:proline iminopeptidase
VAASFTVDVPGGVLGGSEAGDGQPALVLHGGPMSDYTASLVEALPPGLRTIRYQQRGLAPSTVEGPFDIETHVADAVRVLDARAASSGRG